MSVTDPVPEIARVLLRIAWADGSVREIEAEKPQSASFLITAPPLALPLRGDLPLHVISAELEPLAVSLSFQADSRHPIVVRGHSTAGGSEHARRLARVRELAGMLGDRERPGRRETARPPAAGCGGLERPAADGAAEADAAGDPGRACMSAGVAALIAFANARLDEDEAVAVAVVTACRDSREPWPPEQASGHGGPVLTGYLRHFTEGRALREVAAKRAIIAMYARTREIADRVEACGVPAWELSPSDLRDWGDAKRELAALEPVVRELVAVWDGHPAYDQEDWKP